MLTAVSDVGVPAKDQNRRCRMYRSNGIKDDRPWAQVNGLRVFGVLQTSQLSRDTGIWLQIQQTLVRPQISKQKTYPRRRKKSGSSLMASANWQHRREPPKSEMMDGVSYPSFFDHLLHWLNGSIVIISGKVIQNAKGCDFATPRKEVNILFIIPGK